MATRKGAFSDIRALVAKVAEYRTYLNNAVLQHGTLAIDATPERFKTTTVLIWRRNGMQFSKAAATGIQFTAAHPVTASKFGIILIQVNDAGTIATKIPGATQTTTMAYDSAPLALAALPAADSGYIAIGYIAIANNAGAWTANTDDLTAASDVTSATFVDATVTAVPAALA
jgi:hypothetical protein